MTISLQRGNSPRETLAVAVNRTRALWSPIILLEGYLLVTVLIFFLGPIDWWIPNPATLIVFLLVNYGSIWIGYAWGIKKAKIVLSHRSAAEVSMPREFHWLILWSMLLSIFFSLARLIAIRGGIGEVFETLLSPGQAYAEAQAIAQLDRDRAGIVGPTTNYRWAFRISTLFAVFNGLYLPLVMVCWKRMNVLYRVFFVVAVLSTITFTLGMGTQSGIAFLVFAALPVAVYRIYVKGKPLNSFEKRELHFFAGKSYAKLWIKLCAAIAVCVVVVTVVVFQVDRQEASGRQAELADALVGTFGSVSDHSVIPVTGGRLNFGVVMFCFYLSHGYEGLALAMELPFEWMYGFGWSKALQVIYHDYLGGPDLFERSYLARNEAHTGWPALSWWSTIFPWLASDTTFFGTFIIMLLIGFLIARVWSDILLTGNPMGFAVLAQMFILVFMFPANNALAQNLDSLFALIGVLIIYALSRKYFIKKDKAPFPHQTTKLSDFVRAPIEQ